MTEDGSFISKLLNLLGSFFFIRFSLKLLFIIITLIGNVSIVAFLINSVQLSIILLSINTILPINFYCFLKIFGSTVIPNISDWAEENEESSYNELGFNVKKQEY